MKLPIALGLTALIGSAPMLMSQVIVETDAYRWSGDSIVQGEYCARAVSPGEIQSTYHARPNYYMGIKPEWKLKNDISAYPQLETPNMLHRAVYNMGLDEMVNAVEPDTTLRTGAAWGGVWTRDVSYSIILSMAYMQPEASKISLMRKVDPMNRIIQDTGSGGAWPISTDRLIWAVAAYEVYKATGDRDWLEYIYNVIKTSLDTDLIVSHDPETGLVKGETSFIDWREQSHPRWMQTADIASTETLSTSAVHCRALAVLSEIAAQLGHKKEAGQYAALSRSIAEAINRHLWIDDKGYYAMYLYGGDNLILIPRAETLGESLAILWDIAPYDRARALTANNPTTPYGAAIFYPQIPDMPPYHNNSLWPWVASYWALANAKVGNEQGALEAFGSVMRPAALFCTNKENFVLDNGDICTELNSSNMLWCLAGNIALTHKMLFGINFEPNGLSFAPFVPRALGDTRTLRGFKYGDATLNITVSGYGNRIKSFKVNGNEQKPFIARGTHGTLDITIEMADNTIEPIGVNHVANYKTLVTPIVTMSGNTLSWNPIYDATSYIVLRDGVKVDTVTTITYDATVPGEYQVIALDANGIETFASQPFSNRPTTTVEMPGATTDMKSTEIIYPAEGPIKGYTGTGFVETDHSTGTLNIPVTIQADGTYIIKFRYANGNGSVYTGNSAAVRTLKVDGKQAGTIVMPHRGEGKWNEWGNSTAVTVKLDKGTHLISLGLEPENENMNIKTNHALIDELILIEK
ncbi:MAG: hypothetical protein K2M68_10155 [Muribaculaceae bacterium]|nr:hypothetical protein [Muribaculaceae bacterium]